MATTRSYTISTAFSNGVDTSCFHVECEAESFSVNFINITVVSDTLTLHFDGELSAGDETVADAVVAAHDPAVCSDSSGDVSIAGFLNVGTPAVPADTPGEAAFSGDVSVDGTFTANDDVTMTGMTTLGGDVFVLDGNGLVIGHTAKIDFGAIPEFQVLGTATPDSSMGFARFENNASGPDVRFLKSRGATIGTNVIVQDGDTLGRIRFQGADGLDFNTTAAEVLCRVDGSPSANNIPGVIVWRTRTAGGALSDKMTLDNAGNLAVLLGFLTLNGASPTAAVAAGDIATPNVHIDSNLGILKMDDGTGHGGLFSGFNTSGNDQAAVGANLYMAGGSPARLNSGQPGAMLRVLQSLVRITYHTTAGVQTHPFEFNVAAGDMTVAIGDVIITLGDLTVTLGDTTLGGKLAVDGASIPTNASAVFADYIGFDGAENATIGGFDGGSVNTQIAIGARAKLTAAGGFVRTVSGETGAILRVLNGVSGNLLKLEWGSGAGTAIGNAPMIISISGSMIFSSVVGTAQTSNIRNRGWRNVTNFGVAQFTFENQASTAGTDTLGDINVITNHATGNTGFMRFGIKLASADASVTEVLRLGTDGVATVASGLIVTAGTLKVVGGGIEIGGAPATATVADTIVFDTNYRLVGTGTTANGAVNGVLRWGNPASTTPGTIALGGGSTSGNVFSAFSQELSGARTWIGFNVVGDDGVANQGLVATGTALGYASWRMRGDGVELHIQSGSVIAGNVASNAVLTITDTDVTLPTVDLTVVAGKTTLGGDLAHTGAKIGHYGTAPIVKQTGVAVTTAALHAAMVNLGLIAA